KRHVLEQFPFYVSKALVYRIDPQGAAHAAVNLGFSVMRRKRRVGSECVAQLPVALRAGELKQNSVRKSARHFDAALRFVLLVLEFFAASVRAGQQFLETAILFLVLVIGQRLVLKRDDAIGATLAGLNDVARL